jgi:hypothetical protein
MEFTKQSDLDAIKRNNSVAKRRALGANNDDSWESEGESTDFSKEYDYLLNLPLSSLTSGKLPRVFLSLRSNRCLI